MLPPVVTIINPFVEFHWGGDTLAIDASRSYDGNINNDPLSFEWYVGGAKADSTESILHINSPTLQSLLGLPATYIGDYLFRITVVVTDTLGPDQFGRPLVSSADIAVHMHGNVPAPGALALLGIGLFGISWLRRTQKAS